MTTADQQQKCLYWIKIALSDLKSSSILYEERQYRTSYFFFQQASEKANKAFALYNNFTTEEELSKVGHDQFKIYRKTLDKQKVELKALVETTENLPSAARDHEMMGLETMKSVQTSQLEMISLIDGLRQKDLVNFSVIELNQMHRLLNSLRSPSIRLPRNPPPEMKESILKMADWAGNFQTPEAVNAKKEIEEWANDPVKSKELYAVMIKVLKITADFSFIFFSLCCSAVLTIQHSSLTRYPADGKDPLKIYTSKLPLVKKQPLFMELLQEALRKLESLIKQS